MISNKSMPGAREREWSVSTMEWKRELHTDAYSRVHNNARCARCLPATPPSCNVASIENRAIMLEEYGRAGVLLSVLSLAHADPGTLI